MMEPHCGPEANGLHYTSSLWTHSSPSLGRVGMVQCELAHHLHRRLHLPRPVQPQAGGGKARLAVRWQLRERKARGGRG